MDGWTDGCMYGRMDGWTDGRMDGWMDGWTNITYWTGLTGFGNRVKGSHCGRIDTYLLMDELSVHFM
jgi:hypothetical protein